MSKASRRDRKDIKRRAKPRSRMQRWLFRYGWLLPIGAILMGTAILLLTYAFASIPLPAEIPLDSSAEVYDRNGRLLGSFSGEERRFLLNAEELDELPPYVEQAVIAAEDRDYYDHGGVSWRGIIRAGWANLTGGEIQQGGSTISQQYIKNAVLHDTSRTWSRKFKEAILAIKLERRFSKQEILGFYLNTIYLGRGAYGIEAAARSYFDRNAKDLTLGQTAFLAGIIPSPESYQPDENKRGARERRDRVLDLMVAEGYISNEEAREAKRGPVRLAEGVDDQLRRQPAAYFMEWIRRDYLEPEFGSELYTAGLKIYTTLDPEMQSYAEEAVSTILPNPEDPQAALVSLTPSGQVRAFVGGKDFTNVKKARGFNFAADNFRQAGSSFKPFTLLAAIEDDISPQSRFSGRSPVTITDEECYTNGQPWQPENFGGSSYGTVTLDQATTNSINTVYAQLITEVGPDAVADLVEDFGFTPEGAAEEIAPNCSLALGTLDVSPLAMARAYAGFDARGALPEVSPIRYVTNDDGDCLVEFIPQKGDCEKELEPEVDQVVDQNSADVLTDTLTHVVAGGTATAANLPDRQEAGKTGTTQNHRDAWFAGYVPQLTTVVWMGYPCQGKTCQDADPDNDLVPLMEYCADPELCRPVVGNGTSGISVTGGSFPAQIWAAYMAQATADMEVETFPIPVDRPDEVINSPAPVPSASASPKKTGDASPKPTTGPSPSVAPSPSGEPTPSGGPTILPSPTTEGDKKKEGDP